MSVHRPRHLVALFTGGAALILSACTDGNGEDGVTTTAPPPETVTVTVAPTAPATVTTTTTTTAATPPAATSTPPLAGGCGSTNFLSEFTEPVVLFCDGSWARAGQAQTDHVTLFRFGDGQWRAHPADGRSPVTEYLCYDEQTLRAAGAPEELVGQVSLCGTAEQGDPR
ncbi:hypothetical protein [Corynebacterium comes]|uniref:Secreted protein n=1 Tax=Corynebacterium comes TaxID=2675218 RepID=A0A6B8W789_9CORY|nr:hypothetical protein [Corynebacterium comes]QGU05820.1 hypothetical protein CETAM_12975 [Corynebacterium comes]